LATHFLLRNQLVVEMLMITLRMIVGQILMVGVSPSNHWSVWSAVAQRVHHDQARMHSHTDRQADVVLVCETGMQLPKSVISLRPAWTARWASSWVCG